MNNLIIDLEYFHSEATTNICILFLSSIIEVVINMQTVMNYVYD